MECVYIHTSECVLPFLARGSFFAGNRWSILFARRYVMCTRFSWCESVRGGCARWRSWFCGLEFYFYEVSMRKEKDLGREMDIKVLDVYMYE